MEIWCQAKILKSVGSIWEYGNWNYKRVWSFGNRGEFEELDIEMKFEDRNEFRVLKSEMN